MQLAFFHIPAEFYLFGLTLLGIARYHQRTLPIALAGLAGILAVKLAAPDFHLLHHLQQEWRLELNLFGLLMGFTLLARHFEESHLPDALPRWLPQGALGGFLLLVLVFVLSAFLDNIAAAMIGAALARAVFNHRVHVGYLAAIVAASNAGGAGSVIGDTTTTMMWIDGVAAVNVLHAAVGAVVALLFFGTVAARQQQAHHPLIRQTVAAIAIDWMRLAIVLAILVGAIASNVLWNFPAAGVWIALALGAGLRPTDWQVLRHALKGSLFLLALVMAASLMPVERLPAASLHGTFVLGIVSAVFDNIPLTALALHQGRYDWGFLAYAVGFGGSMLWFGSSSGVALSNLFPAAKSAALWLKHGWHVPVAYALGFAAMAAWPGWHPHPPHKALPPTPAAVVLPHVARE